MKHSNYRSLLFICFLGFGFEVHAIPVKDIANLESITFWERTGGSAPKAYTFGVNSSQLTTRLSGSLGTSNSDFSGVPGHEFYDVFFSDANGDFNINGEYLSIEGTYDIGLPNGGGLNLAEIGLNFSGSSTEFGNWVASYSALGNNALPQNVGLAIDGDLLTHTTMGNTMGQSERLRVTLGFNSSSGPVPVPEPTMLILLYCGLIVVGAIHVYRKVTKNFF
jgi:hypothetical protein